MKNLPFILLVAALLFVNIAPAQKNYVPNGSFEEFSACPGYGHSSPIYDCIGWRQYNFTQSYYYNQCNTVGSGVPVNQDGYQYPAHGNAYAGVELRNTNGDDKSYLVRKITPLFPGARYEVSMSVSLTNQSYYSCDGLGAYFYLSAPDSIPGAGTAPVTPQISYTSYGVIKDTSANWVRLVKTFTADSAYDNIVIGGFLLPKNTTYDIVNKSTSNRLARYYIDSVVVSLADSFYLDPTDSLYCAGDTVNMPYVAVSQFHSNNIFTVQLSDASGSFATPVTLGSVNSVTSGTIKCIFPKNTPTGTGYRIRLMSSNVKDTALEYGRVYKIGNVEKPVATNNSPICIIDTLRLFASTTTAGVTYSWTGPIGLFSTSQNPIEYPLGLAHNGDYVVSANLYGCAVKDTTTVAISNGNLLHDFAKSNSPVCTGDTIKLFSGFTASGLTYSWVGPNSFSAGQQNVNVSNAVASQTGDYILTINNGGCIVKDTVTVAITTRPAVVVATVNTLCEKDNLSLSVTSSFTGYSYTWRGPNSFASNTASPVINNATTANSGDYIVSGFYKGCTLKDTVTASVKPYPTKPVANNDITLCAGSAINLTASSATSGVSYSWAGPVSYTSNIQNPTISNSTTGMSGDYIVSADLNGCIVKDTTAITVKPMPAAVTLSNNSPICVGSTLQLNSTASTTGVSYAWSGPNSFSASTQNSSISNSATAATGWYKMTVDLNGCLFTDSIAAIVHPKPATPSVSYNSPVCAGENLQLQTATVTGATYVWTGVNAFNANTQNPVRSNIITADAGQYQVTVTVNGCTSSPGSTTVSINPSPFVAIFSLPADSICVGELATFIALPNNAGSNPQYNWLINGSQVGTGSTYSTTGLTSGDIVSCNMTENTKCSVPFTDPSNDVSLEVLPWLAPAVSITASPNRTLHANEYIKFTAVPVNGGLLLDYQWKRNGQDIVGATGNTWSANALNDNDVISVELLSNYKCPQPPTASSNSITVRVGTAIDDLPLINGLALYPNPNKGRFTLEGNVAAGETVQLTIINTLGQVVYVERVKMERGSIRHEVNIQDIAAGVYLLKVNGEQGGNVLRLVVE